MKKFTIILSAALLIFTSCKKKPVPEASVEVVEGVTIVRNPPTPRYPKRRVHFEQELAIDAEDESGEIILFQPASALVDDEENIFIADFEDQKIKVFDRNGKFLKAIGGKGQGPGEFQNIINMGFMPDGRLLVLDTSLRRTSLFDNQGTFINSHTWRGFHMMLFLTDQSSYIVDDNVFVEPRTYYVKKLDEDGGEILSFGEFTPMGMKMERIGDMFYSMVVPFLPRSIFVGDSARGWLYHCLNDRYLIEVYDRDGKIFRRIERPYDPVPFTDEDAERFFAAYDRNPDQVYTKLARQIELPKVKVITEWMRVDDKGNLWVATQEVEEGEDRTLRAYDIFSPEGIYDARVWIEINLLLFKNGTLYTLSEDEDGFETLIRYRVEWRD